uniref:Transposase n=1 Tax=Heterorhabditis bacteriophora TaxID=37862 RepID=A0A1I7X2X0_HETBA
MYWSLDVPPYTQHSLIQAQARFRARGSRLFGLTLSSGPRVRFCSEQADMCI